MMRQVITCGQRSLRYNSARGQGQTADFATEQMQCTSERQQERLELCAVRIQDQKADFAQTPRECIANADAMHCECRGLQSALWPWAEL